MSHRTVPAAHGIEWIRNAAQLLLKNPMPFALMGLILAVIGFVPLLGAIAILVLGPALYGGLIYAAARQERGEPAEVGDLFQAFKQDGKIGPMVLLCLPNVALMMVLMVLLVVGLVAFGLAAAVSAAASGGELPTLPALLAAVGIGGALTFALILIPLALLVAALLFFSISRVMLQDIEPFAAMKGSLRASVDNIGAFLIAVIALGLLRILVAVLLGSVIPVLGALVAGVVVEPLLAATGYIAYRDVYANTQSDTGPAPLVGGDSMSAEL